MLALNGIFPPVPTPFGPNEELALGSLQDNIRKLSQFDLSGFLLLGSNGEMVMLSESEKQQVFEAARGAIPADRIMLAGTGEQSTRATTRLTKVAAASGADAALVLNPSYYKGLMTGKALINHYRSVADTSPIPIIIYNMPACSGLDLTADLAVELSCHPNIIGMKDSGGNITKMGDIIRAAEPGFQMLAGSAGFLLPALSIGAVGGIMALANIAPAWCLDIYRYYTEGKLDIAREIQLRMIPVNSAVTSGGGVAALKVAMDYLGLYGGPARSPILPLDPGQIQLLHDLLDANEIKL